MTSNVAKDYVAKRQLKKGTAAWVLIGVDENPRPYSSQ